LIFNQSFGTKLKSWNDQRFETDGVFGFTIDWLTYFFVARKFKWVGSWERATVIVRTLRFEEILRKSSTEFWMIKSLPTTTKEQSTYTVFWYSIVILWASCNTEYTVWMQDCTYVKQVVNNSNFFSNEVVKVINDY
jgi:hypothetical protein